VLLITADGEIRAHVQRYAARAGAYLDHQSSLTAPVQLRWGRSPLVLLGTDVAPALTRARPRRLPNMVLLTRRASAAGNRGRGDPRGRVARGGRAHRRRLAEQPARRDRHGDPRPAVHERQCARLRRPRHRPTGRPSTPLRLAGVAPPNRRHSTSSRPGVPPARPLRAPPGDAAVQPGRAPHCGDTLPAGFYLDLTAVHDGDDAALSADDISKGAGVPVPPGHRAAAAGERRCRAVQASTGRPRSVVLAG